MSYADLAARADGFATRLEGRGSVLYLEARNDVEAVVAYLGALRAGHAVMWAIQSSAEVEGRLCETYRPDNIYHHNGAAWILERGQGGPAVHPDLSVLLSTSGSTGSPKLVRLSRAAVDANARQIAEYLGIGPEERAITSLPLGYSYGLSVLNSHLAAGASVVLTGRSVTDPAFWMLFRETCVTSMAGVPHVYELLERLSFRDDPPPSLRTLTQAGGRLAPELVETYARWSQARGIRFFPMYGQTEATARMAYLPPEAALDYPGCIGRPVPGGEFRLLDEKGRTVDADDVPGELVFRGPNVMMGYGLTREDLARGPDIDELHTGDIAVRVDGRFYRVVGRASRFSKIAGKRIGLDDLETLAGTRGVSAVAAGDDELIALWLRDSNVAPDQMREFIAARCGVPLSFVVVLFGGEAPRLASGKVNYAEILRRARDARDVEERDRRRRGSPIAATFAKALGRPAVESEATFVSLGGDSLAYVQASIEVERQLGYLPDGWERMSIAQLDMLAEARSPGRRRFERVPADVILRAVAIIAIILGHIGGPDYPLKGGAMLLFVLAGYSLARFQRDSLLSGRPQEVLVNFVLRVILPYYLLLLTVAPLAKDASLSVPTLLLVSNLVGEERGPLMPYWFPEAMLQCLILFGLTFVIPPVRNFAKENPFASGVVFLAVAMAANVLTPVVWEAPLIAGRARSPDAWGYGLLVGWAACFARKPLERFGLLAAVTAFAAWDYIGEPSRFAFLSVGLAMLLFGPPVPLPRVLSRPLVMIAAASFYIYLAHMLVIQLLSKELGVQNRAVILVVMILAGIIGHYLWQLALPRAFSFVKRAWTHRGLRTRRTEGRSL